MITRAKTQPVPVATAVTLLAAGAWLSTSNAVALQPAASPSAKNCVSLTVCL